MNACMTLVRTAAAAGALIASHAWAAGIAVPGKANPFLAGQPNGTTCCDGDTAPQENPTPMVGLVGGDTLSFTATGGVNYQAGAVAPSADGFTDQLFTMTADAGTGVSGPANVYVSGLVGVFTNGQTPTGAAPAPLDSGVAFKRLTPGLNQIFWIGDGLSGTGSGTRQKFVAPAGATKLYLGTVDGSGWFNNVGKITVKIKLTPGS